jgi:hypothetical protein
LLSIILYDIINIEKMNTYLTKLFDKYNISDRNRYEILQIFSLLPLDKKQNLLNNFWTLAVKVNKIEEELNAERNVLLWFIARKDKKIQNNIY